MSQEGWGGQKGEGLYFSLKHFKVIYWEGSKNVLAKSVF